MKKLVFSLFALLFASTVVFAADFYKHLSDIERKELADAYYMVGDQYKKVGEVEKGSSFIGMAYLIYPGFDPKMIGIPLKGFETPEEKPVQQEPAKEKERPVPPENAVRYQFAKLLRGFFNEDVKTILTLVSDPLLIPDVGVSYTKRDLTQVLLALFAAYDLKSVAPTSIYNLSTIRVQEVQKDIWALTIDLVDNPSIDLSSESAVWSKTENFFYKKTDKTWLLVSIGSLKL